MSDMTEGSTLNAFAVRQSIMPWSVSAGKRAFDAVFATSALILTMPLIVVIAALVRSTSRGPALFRQTRVGQAGRSFTLFKFRSMSVRTEKDSCLTFAGDRRVTPLGKILRKTKLDELPQFYNVLRGDMSMVGPRPDVPEYVATLPSELRHVLLLKPGVTGAASIWFRNEEELLAKVSSEQLQQFYCDALLPNKVQMDLEYARSASFFRDLKIIAKTVAVLFERHGQNR